jgi:hypothetical protein
MAGKKHSPLPIQGARSTCPVCFGNLTCSECDYEPKGETWCHFVYGECAECENLRFCDQCYKVAKKALAEESMWPRDFKEALAVGFEPVGDIRWHFWWDLDHAIEEQLRYGTIELRRGDYIAKASVQADLLIKPPFPVKVGPGPLSDKGFLAACGIKGLRTVARRKKTAARRPL